MGEGIQPRVGLEGAKSPEIVNTKKTVRSHHLRFIGWAMGLGERKGTPESVAQAFADMIEASNSSFWYYRWYAETTVNINKEGFVGELSAGLREFLEEPDEADYTITENEPDTLICKGVTNCGCGGHCGMRRIILSEGRMGILDESKDTSTFIATAKKSKVGIYIQPGTSVSTDQNPVVSPIRRFTLKVGQIKQVLAEIEKSDMFKSFFDDPFRDLQ